MGAIAFVGDWGASKSMLMVDWLEAGRRKGMETASNFGYVNEDYSFTKPSEVLRLIASPARRAVPLRDRPILRLAIDEAAVLFPCRGWSRWPAEMDLVMNEARKFKVELAYSCPNLSRVDVNLRLATTQVNRCRRLLKRMFDHPEFGRIPKPLVVSVKSFEYGDDKMGERIGGGWRTWGSLAPCADLFNSFNEIDSVYDALELAAAKLDSGKVKDEWGSAAAPERTVVQLQDGRGRSHHGRHSQGGQL